MPTPTSSGDPADRPRDQPEPTPDPAAAADSSDRDPAAERDNAPDSGAGPLAGGDEPDQDLWPGAPLTDTMTGAEPDGEDPADLALLVRVERRRLRQVRDTVAALETSVAELRGQVTTVRSRHAELAASVSEEIAPTVQGFIQTTTEELGGLRAQVDELCAEHTAAQRLRNPPVDWIGMSAERAVEQWPVLARWIAQSLVPWYELTRDELPDCWSLHRPVVVELSWLRSAHRQAYLAHSHPHITAEWHVRWRPHLIGRIREVIDPNKCKPGTHQPDRGNPLLVPPPADGSSLPRAQLAHPQHWWPFYTHAYHADLAERRTADEGQNWTPPPPSDA